MQMESIKGRRWLYLTGLRCEQMLLFLNDLFLFIWCVCGGGYWPAREGSCLQKTEDSLELHWQLWASSCKCWELTLRLGPLEEQLALLMSTLLQFPRRINACKVNDSDQQMPKGHTISIVTDGYIKDSDCNSSCRVLGQHSFKHFL